MKKRTFIKLVFALSIIAYSLHFLNWGLGCLSICYLHAPLFPWYNFLDVIYGLGMGAFFFWEVFPELKLRK